jgi:integrase
VQRCEPPKRQTSGRQPLPRRFLALTGWRSGEALTLRWNAVDLARRTAMLSAATDTETKTGDNVPLSVAACDVLAPLHEKPR